MEWAQLLSNEPAAHLEQCLSLMFIQVSAGNKYAAGLLKAAVLCLRNLCLCRSYLQALPEPLEASGVSHRLGGEVVCSTEDLPQLDGTEHLQEAFGVPGQLGGGGVDEHLIPRLLVLMPGKDHRFAIRLGEKVRVEV
ncbi:hypothetical protein P873_11055 [Arenimonas composti TR7-09 = DSM 18010]|uniref:Uncharacterized protein n=1 Tax=Arenimonas composti TR7-09 = DSM 18010 TaxID=1121013 RepID=A0A091BER6_9GAMM|nr:hypothetical protein P873_11055 [Arenimonas composti TR7-09 = DSM 18010]